MVLNSKGGCGKSTLATNLASYYATAGERVSLVDFDAQSSSLDWLAARPESLARIGACKAKGGELLLPHGSGYLIMDPPAGVHGKALKPYVKLAQSLIIPVLPSPMDMRATARFIEELLLLGRVSAERTRVAVVANRVREHTLVYRSLERFLASLEIPFLTSLRDSQNYIRAAEKGMGVFELPPSLARHDVEQWQPILAWLASRDSMPRKAS
ncbi:MAG: AAA family ATPase [Gammaproteobacteria bacterium]|nr:AAA family ATPase [Gammaproteobacteria bacterium]